MIEHAIQLKDAYLHVCNSDDLQSYCLLESELLDALEDFKDNMDEDSNQSDIAKGMDEAWKKLSAYYAKTDSGPTYAMASAMLPGMCYDWWSNNCWEKKYVTVAKRAVEAVWRSYAPIDTPATWSATVRIMDAESLLTSVSTAKVDELDCYTRKGQTGDKLLIFW
ncbi:hypothetical protein CPB97_000510 [Podila verticillata]|nr:hypothetical protein CPB97_000510 [Podila verticillata]